MLWLAHIKMALWMFELASGFARCVLKFTFDISRGLCRKDYHDKQMSWDSWEANPSFRSPNATLSTSPKHAYSSVYVIGKVNKWFSVAESIRNMMWIPLAARKLPKTFWNDLPNIFHGTKMVQCFCLIFQRDPIDHVLDLICCCSCLASIWHESSWAARTPDSKDDTEHTLNQHEWVSTCRKAQTLTKPICTLIDCGLKYFWGFGQV